MTSQVGNGESINADEAALELCKLREAAKLAAIYHSDERKFQRRTDLSHVVHATLHCVQFAITSAIEIFHHVHHYVNQRAREKDSSSPPLPEERNPIFFVYPICMLVSLVFAILWLVKKIVHDTPVIIIQEEDDKSSISEKKSDSDVSENFIAREKQETGNDEFEQYLAPIPTLKDLSVSTLVVNSTAQEKGVETSTHTHTESLRRVPIFYQKARISTATLVN
ncbi:hypothetical protein DMN91_000979 [Ooceraea biroi]|uniref:Uncharacterized protein n=1 Tax=Ooceraea biroi TaxID=2015173 RepID=A0A3L8E4M8_OOCBI|nr:hypothetical protein DMN91_000979 [Ooceraea biroi]